MAGEPPQRGVETLTREEQSVGQPGGPGLRTGRRVLMQRLGNDQSSLLAGMSRGKQGWVVQLVLAPEDSHFMGEGGMWRKKNGK